MDVKFLFFFFFFINSAKSCQAWGWANFFQVIKGFFSAFSLPSLVDIDEISMKPGDIIKCRMGFGIPGFRHFSPIWHMMIASDTDKIIHYNDHKIEEVNVKNWRALDTKGFTNCENMGPGSLTREDSVKLARQWVNKRVYYHLLFCNCQHWAHFWSHGYAGMSYNSGFKINKQCDIPASDENDRIDPGKIFGKNNQLKNLIRPDKLNLTRL